MTIAVLHALTASANVLRCARAACLVLIAVPLLARSDVLRAQECGERADLFVACTSLGAVRGAPDGDLVAFRGIPYAAPPTGALRWRPPQPAEAWEGIRDASRFGAVCPQLEGGEVVGDEDCLTLNIWRPSNAPREPLPVMVYLTGGGNTTQSGQGTPATAFSGTHLVPQGVIFVSFNIRLGVFGFLAHPAFDAERPERVSGNYGSLDQIGMLQWIKRNISAFGGDPAKVFLFGTSAGGGNICALATSPLTQGLIHGVAMQSSVPTGCEIQTLRDLQAGTGQRAVQTVG
jgi:para-nitrobenzyl esterase